MSRCPWLAARCRGVSSPRFMTLMRAPLMMSMSTTLERPSLQAQWRGLKPWSSLQNSNHTHTKKHLTPRPDEEKSSSWQQTEFKPRFKKKKITSASIAAHKWWKTNKKHAGLENGNERLKYAKLHCGGDNCTMCFEITVWRSNRSAGRHKSFLNKQTDQQLRKELTILWLGTTARQVKWLQGS